MMSDFNEIELKLRLIDPSKYDAIVADALLAQMNVTGECQISDFDNTYFDTQDHRLIDGQLALRVRKSGDRYIATVKDSGTAEGGLYIRGEWNKPIDGLNVSTRLFSDMPIGPKLAEVVGTEALHPLLKTLYHRTAMNLTCEEGSVIEFAADMGEIVSNGKSEPLCEIELELKSGSADSLIKLGASLSERYPLMVEMSSKYERGLILQGFPKQDEVSREPELNSDETVREAAQKILISILQEILDLQETFLEKPEDPESAHKCRVKIRQCRAFLSFVKPVVKRKEYIDVQDKLRKLAGQFSSIREIDVLLRKWEKLLDEHPEMPKNTPGLLEVLQAEREREQTRVFQYISAASVTPIILNIWGWIQDVTWAERGIATLSEYSKSRIKKWSKRMRRGMKTNSFNDLAQTHALRILGKKLRYVLTYLNSIISDDSQITLPQLKRWQENLGSLCDNRRNVIILQELKKKYENSSLQYESGVLVGYQLLDSDNIIKKLK